MEPLEDALTNLRRRWPLVVVTAVAALLIVLVLNLVAPPRYRSTARFLVSPVILEDPGDVVDSTEALDNATIVANYAEVFNSPSLQRRAAARVGAEALLDYEFSSVVLPETSVVQLTVTGPETSAVAGLANVLGEEVVTYMEPFSTIYQLRELDPAPVPEAPYSSPLLLDLGVALAVGTIAGIALAIGLSYISALISLPASQPAQESRSVPPRPPRDTLPARPFAAERNTHERPGRSETT